MITDLQAPKTPVGRAVKRRKLRVDEVVKLDLTDLRRAGFFELPLMKTPWMQKSRTPNGHTVSTVGYALLRLEANAGIVGIFAPKDDSPTDWDLQYFVGLTPNPCKFGGQRWWWVCPNYDKYPRCRNFRRRVLYRPTPGDTFACFDCHRLTYSSRQHHRSLEVEYRRPLRALFARNEGRTYEQIPHEDKVELHELMCRREKYGRARKGFL